MFSAYGTVVERRIRPEHRPNTCREMLERWASNIPIIDVGDLADYGAGTVQAISKACREWGFFQVVNHGVSGELVERVRKVWRDFAVLPKEEKDKFAKDATTQVGYDDYFYFARRDNFFLEILPESLRNHDKWPTNPASCRETTEEYSREMEKLSQKLLKALSLGLGLDGKFLQRAFGGDHCSANLRANFYYKHLDGRLLYLQARLPGKFDSGGLTILLPDDRVVGLEVRKNNYWVDVDAAPNAFIINIGDQIEVLSNGMYKSVEYHNLVGLRMDRLSIAFFYNPNDDVMIEPAAELVTPDNPAHYAGMKYKEYRDRVHEVEEEERT